MPDLREVFQMSTQKVRPDRGFTERQEFRQRRRTRNRKIGAYAMAAAVVRNGRTAPIPADPPSEELGIFAPVSGWIAFRIGGDLRAVDPANPANVVLFGPSGGADPIAWSTDGTRLLLRPQPELEPVLFNGQWGIGTAETTSPLDGFVLNSDGSSTRLTGDGRGSGPNATWGSFSPDGTEVVYAGSGSQRGPYIVDADGGQPRLLGKPGPGGEPFPEWAAWSPDGSRIAFVDFWEDHPTYGHHAYTLSFLDPDTGDTLGVGNDWPTQLPPVNVAAAGLAWSPDGSQLAFWAVVPDKEADPSNVTLGPGGDFPAQIFVINADGSGLRQLTRAGDNRWPTWSPDGSRIAFARGQLELMSGPDGTQAAYVRPGSRELFTMASDGTDVQRVEGVWPEGAIAWNPVP
jgi:Tol biopolymer transport system component